MYDLPQSRPVDSSDVTIARHPMNSRPRIHQDIDPELLATGQAYLKARQAGNDVGPELVEAWESLFRFLHPVVHSLANASRLTGQDPEDAVQEAWIVLIARLPAYRHDPARGPLLAWVAVVIRRALTNAGRRRTRRAHDAVFAPADMDPPDARNGNPLMAVERAERIDQVRHALSTFQGSIGPTAYDVVLLYWVEGWTASEVAARLGLTFGQVIGHLNRAKPKLRACLAAEVGRKPFD